MLSETLHPSCQISTAYLPDYEHRQAADSNARELGLAADLLAREIHLAWGNACRNQRRLLDEMASRQPVGWTMLPKTQVTIGGTANGT